MARCIIGRSERRPARGWPTRRLLVALLLLVPSVAFADAAPDWMPSSWKVGATLDGQRVERLETHAEFVRVHFSSGGFEIVACRPTDDTAWCEKGLRIQPLPGADANEEALRHRLAEIRDHEPAAQAEIAPIASGRQAQTVGHTVQRLRGVATWEAGFAIGFALLALWLGWLAIGPDPNARRGWYATALLVAAAPLLGRSLLGEGSVDIRSLMRIHEANTEDTVRLLVAPYVFHAPAWLLTDGTRGIAGVVAANRLLWLIGLAGTATWMRRLMGSWRAAGIVTALGFSGGVTLATFSGESETALAWCIELAGVAAFVVADDPRRPALVRLLALGQLLLLPLVWTRRGELAFLVGIALAALAIRSLSRHPSAGPALRARAVSFGRALLHPVPVVVFFALALWHGAHIAELQDDVNALAVRVFGDAAADRRVLITSLFTQVPTDLSWLLLPLETAQTRGLLFGGLFAWGAWSALRAGGASLWLVVGLASLYKVYRHAGHGFDFEMQRYLATVEPLLVATVAFGAASAWSRFDTWTRGKPFRHAAIAGLALVALVDERYARDDDSLGKFPRTPGIAADSQTEFRALASALVQFPECALVTRNVAEVDDEARVARDNLLVFGASWRLPLVVTDEAELPATLAEMEPAPRCALVFDGIECGAAGGAPCDRLGTGQVLWDAPRMGMTYRHRHWGATMPSMRPFTLRPLAPHLLPAGPLREAPPPTATRTDGAALPAPAAEAEATR